MLLKTLPLFSCLVAFCYAGVVKRQGSGCYYKGQTHQQGQQWTDGCQYQCTCVDGSVGKYNCNTICLNWNLPPECHMNQPAPGKCCPTPSCPPGWQVNYPPGYTPK